MTNWYIVGNCWKLIRQINQTFGGMVNVILYDGTPAKGRARQTRYGWLVYSEAK